MRYQTCDLGGRHQRCDLCGTLPGPLQRLTPPLGTRDSRVENWACSECMEKVWDLFDSVEKLQRLIGVSS